MHRVYLPCLLALSLVACASRPSGPPAGGMTEPRTAQRSPGYEPEIYQSVQASRATLDIAGERVELALRTPGVPGRQPLIVYLAGLGDSVDAAADLQETWAQAGYAVLVIQGALDGPASLSHKDKHERARQAHAPAALQQRLERLAGVLQALQQPQGGALPAEYLARIDFSQWLLAGFDIGAQTAQAAAGEHWADIRPLRQPGLRGLMLLSPYVDFSGESFSTRYADLRLPVLAVSSAEDIDRFGFVTNPRLRRQLFNHLPAGDKYELQLSWASHAVIGGASDSPLPDDAGERKRNQPSGKRSERGGPGGGMGGGMGGGPGGGMGGPGGAMGKPGGGMDGSDGTRDQGREAGPSMAQPMLASAQTQSLKSVSLAWLDAVLRKDDLASTWLTRNANRWLGDTGKLYMR